MESNGTPLQQTDLPAEVNWRFVDLSGLSTERRESEAKGLLEDEPRRAFNLSTGPLLRAVLVQFAQDNFMLLLTMHHIVSDGWSAEILMNELSALYESFTQNRIPSLGELPIQ